MLNAGDVTALVVPLVLPVIIGWMLVRAKLARPADAKPLTTVFLWVCAPAELIHTLAKEDLSDLLEGRLLAGTVVMFAIVYGAVFLFYRLVLGRSDGVAAFAAFAAAGFNALAIGLPVMLGLFGSKGSVPAVVATIVFLMALVPLTLTLVGADQRGEDDEGSVFLGALLTAVKNPIVIATGIGLLLAAFDVTLSKTVDNSLQTLGAATVVTALVALGMTVDLGDLRTGGAEMLGLSAVRMVVAPAIAIGLALALGTSDLGSAAFVILFAQPTAKTVFVLSDQSGVFQKPVAGVVALTTLSSLVMLPVWIVICDQVWPTAFVS